MRISTNVMALGAWKNLVQTTSGISKTLERLSSGHRINRAADDAAGLTISEMMRAQIRGLNQAMRNAQDGISLVQTADGALSQVHAILQRLRELAVQASTDTLTDANREEIQKEVRQLTDQINQIGNTTHFNSIKLLNGSLTGPLSGPAEVRGANVPGPIVIHGPTAGYAQGGLIPDTGYTGSSPKAQPVYVMGNRDLRTASLDFSSLTATERTLGIRVDGAYYQITLAARIYTDEADLVNDINTRLSQAGAPVIASVSADGFHRLVLTHFSPGSDHTLDVIDSDPTNPNDVYSRLFSSDVTVGGVDKGDVWIHSVTDGYTTGSVKITDPGLALNPLTLSASDTLLLRYTTDGQTWNVATVYMPSKTYDGTYTKMRHDLLADLQAQIDAAVGNPGIVKADFEPDHTLRLTLVGGGVGSRIEVIGGTAMDRLFGDVSTHLRHAGQPANNELTFSLDGQPQIVTLPSGHYDDVDAVVTQLNIQFAANNIAATASNAGGAVRITSDSLGATSSVTNIGGSAAAELNLVNATVMPGTSGNRRLALNVDGEDVVISLPEGTYADLNALAGMLEQAINNATQTAADVKVRYDGGFIITSGTTGTQSRLVVQALPDDDAASTLGLAGLNDQGTEAGPMAIQIGANPTEMMTFAIGDMRARALGLTSTDPAAPGFDGSQPISNEGAPEYVISLKTRADAQRAQQAIDRAIQTVSSERANLGAVQNRFEHTVTNLQVAAENLTAAQSRIRDADMALEMMEFVRQQILLQSGTAMLAQANAVPQTVLRLLE